MAEQNEYRLKSNLIYHWYLCKSKQFYGGAKWFKCTLKLTTKAAQMCHVRDGEHLNCLVTRCGFNS